MNGLLLLYEGKSKKLYAGPNDDTYIIHYKDSATAFNGEKKEELSGKGELNAAISHFIYAYLEKRAIKTHLIEVIDQTAALVKKAEIISLEVIVRNIAAGSFSRRYGNPEGSPLQNTVVEFCYKSDELGDPMINESQITALSIATPKELAIMTEKALAINKLLSPLFEKAGIRLVDFKLEFGRYGSEIILCDEISPDSCRLWDINTNKKLDKDRFRHDLGDVLGGYKDVLRRLRDVL